MMKSIKTIKKTIKNIHNLIGPTLGPMGKNVIIDRKYDLVSTNDGYTILKYYANDIVSFSLLEAAKQTNDKVGDATTTTILLATYLFLQCCKFKKNILQNLEKVENIYNKVIIEIKKDTMKDLNNDIIRNIVYTSTNDIQLTNIITEAYENVGFKGIIQLEEANNTSLVIKQGLKIKIINTNKRIKIKDVKILLCININTIDTNIFLEEISDYLDNKTLFIITNVKNQELEETLRINNINNIYFFCIALDLSSYEEIINDIAIYTNSIPYYLNKKLESNLFGKANKIEINNNEMIIYSNENLDIMNKEVKKIKEQINDGSYYEKRLLENRLERISERIAIIKLNRNTEVETKYLYYKAEDAINLLSTLQEGYVIGGGIEFVNIYKRLYNKKLSKIEKTALKSILVIVKTILVNSGIKITNKRLTRLINKKNHYYGFNGKTIKWTNLFHDGILDSSLGLIEALTNSYSVIKMLLNCHFFIVNNSEKEVNM